jgi:uncharacterized protein
MEFHTAQLLREPVGSRRDYHVTEPCETEDLSSVELGGDVSLLRTDAGILVVASLQADIERPCCRCLKSARIGLQLEVEEEFYPTRDVLSGAPLPEPEDPTPFLIDAHHILDLCEAVRQQLILAEPMRPLCRDDCAGLCVTCGADLNSEGCSCPGPGADERWRALDALPNSSDV